MEFMAASPAFPASPRPSLHVEIDLHDPETVHEILSREEGPARDQYVQLALRIGVLALRMAGGQVDERRLRDEGERLVRSLQSELESHVKQHVDGDNSTLARAITARVGEQSPIFRMLDPRNSEGLKFQIETTVRGLLDAHGRGLLTEFSLDSETSALSRLKRALNEEVANLVRKQEEFRTEVAAALSAIQARRKADERGTVHGVEFEQALAAFVHAEAQRLGDVAEPVGNTTGAIRNCKTGDLVVTLGAESAAPQARIVWEAKQAASYTMKGALEEIEVARKNREAQVGIFVFSAKSAPPNLEAFTRHGRDIVVVWDSEDPASDALLKAAFSLARALVVREARGSAEAGEALRQIEAQARAVERQAGYLGEMKTWAETIKNNGTKIADRAGRMQEELQAAAVSLDQQLLTLRTRGE
jgi:hypothetical protein